MPFGGAKGGIVLLLRAVRLGNSCCIGQNFPRQPDVILTSLNAIFPSEVKWCSNPMEDLTWLKLQAKYR